jgi:hypothetical protein
MLNPASLFTARNVRVDSSQLIASGAPLLAARLKTEYGTQMLRRFGEYRAATLSAASCRISTAVKLV